MLSILQLLGLSNFVENTTDTAITFISDAQFMISLMTSVFNFLSEEAVLKTSIEKEHS